MGLSSVKRMPSLTVVLALACLPGLACLPALAADRLDALLKQADVDIDAGDSHGATINLDAVIAETEHLKNIDAHLPAALMYKAWVAITYQHLDEAESLLRRALGYLGQLSKTHKTVDNEARCQATLASLKEAQGKYSESEAAYLKSIELLQSIGDNDNQAPSYNGLGALYFKMQRYADSEKAHRKAMELFLVADGKESDDYICAINNLATALEREKKYDEAAKLSSEALALADTKYGGKSERLLPILDNLATVYERKKQFDLAEVTAKKSLDLAQELVGKDAPALWEYVSSLALMYLDNGKYKLAEEELLRAISLLGHAKGDNGDALSLLYYRLGNCYEATKQDAPAETFYKKAIASTTVPKAKKVYDDGLANLLKKTHSSR
jgi:tetratricopeptide (TPR) repeat protein